MYDVATGVLSLRSPDAQLILSLVAAAAVIHMPLSALFRVICRSEQAVSGIEVTRCHIGYVVRTTEFSNN